MPLNSNKVRPYVELGGCLAIVVASSMGAWFLPDEYHRKVTIGLLAIGVFFDLLSLFYHLMTMAIGKFLSGFPMVGLFFYAWFILSSRYSLVAWGETDLDRVLLFKLADLAMLLALHALCQLPTLRQKPRSEYK